MYPSGLIQTYGYREPSGVYFSEYDMGRFLREYEYYAAYQYDSIPSQRPSGIDFLQKPGFITSINGSAYRFIQYHLNEYLNKRIQGVNGSGIIEWMKEVEPLFWRFHDQGPSGNFTRFLVKSIPFPFDSFDSYSGGNPANYDFVFSYETNTVDRRQFSQDTARKLPFYQSQDILKQIRSGLDYVFKNPLPTSGHPAASPSGYGPFKGINGNVNIFVENIPIPALAKEYSLPLNNLNLRPTGWLDYWPSTSIINSGFYPFLDSVQQIRDVFEYTRNHNCVFQLIQMGNNSWPALDSFSSELWFALMQTGNISVDFSGYHAEKPAFFNLHDRFGNVLNSGASFNLSPYKQWYLNRYDETHSSDLLPISGGFTPLNSGYSVYISTGLPVTFYRENDSIRNTHSAYLQLDSDHIIDENPYPFTSGNSTSNSYHYVLTNNLIWKLSYLSGYISSWSNYSGVIPYEATQLNPSGFSININGISIPASKYDNCYLTEQVLSFPYNFNRIAGPARPQANTFPIFEWKTQSGYYSINTTLQYQVVKRIIGPPGFQVFYSGIYYTTPTISEIFPTTNRTHIINSFNENLSNINTVLNPVTDIPRTHTTGVWIDYTFNSSGNLASSDLEDLFNNWQEMWEQYRTDYSFQGLGASTPPFSWLNATGNGNFRLNSLDLNLYVDLYSGATKINTERVSLSSSPNLSANIHSWISGSLPSFPNTSTSWWN